MAVRELKLRRDPACPVCGDSPTVRELIDYEQFCGVAPAAATTKETSPVPELSVEALKGRIDAGKPVFILDVREPNEFQICRIPGSVLIPLAQLPNRLSELPAADDPRELIVHCKMGGRSAKAVKQLQELGITHAQNLTGGILAWIDRVDPSQPKY